MDSKVQMTEYALVGLSTNESSNVYSGLTPHVDTDIINSKFSKYEHFTSYTDQIVYIFKRE